MLPKSSKVFEKPIFNVISECVIENNLRSSAQSCFNPNDFCGVLLDLSKAFDGVWHEGLLCKLKNCEINANFIHLIELFLHNWRQRVVKNGQSRN